ncbi:hypothetical protein B0H14DRAFT_3136638 [Mycena olivaceomarginata]|nr:hypothetical protein B0H14DRAFT_3136638 [Mycena olivaceomarginata]
MKPLRILSPPAVPGRDDVSLDRANGATKPRPRPQSSKSRGIKFKQYIPPDERDPPRIFERLAEKIFGTSEERMRRKKERELKRKRTERLAQQTEEYYAVLGPERQLGDGFAQGLVGGIGLVFSGPN